MDDWHHTLASQAAAVSFTHAAVDVQVKYVASWFCSDVGPLKLGHSLYADAEDAPTPANRGTSRASRMLEDTMLGDFVRLFKFKFKWFWLPASSGCLFCVCVVVA